MALRDGFLWLHGVFALVYFIITVLCMAHHAIRQEYREDEKVCTHLHLSSTMFSFSVKKKKRKKSNCSNQKKIQE